jgi:hypothetical protein
MPVPDVPSTRKHDLILAKPAAFANFTEKINDTSAAVRLNANYPVRR